MLELLETLGLMVLETVVVVVAVLNQVLLTVGLVEMVAHREAVEVVVVWVTPAQILLESVELEVKEPEAKLEFGVGR